MSEASKLDPKMQVLVVDDLATARKVMRKLLGQIGLANIEEASNGEEALKAIEKSQYQLIIMDWNMPKMSGLQFIEQIRTKDQFKGLPVIMVTANNTKEHVVTAMSKGASDYITKPFSAEILAKKISGVLDSSEET